MRFVIRHEIKGRIRIHLLSGRMTCSQADVLQYCLAALYGVKSARVNERTQNAVLYYTGERARLIEELQRFCLEQAAAPQSVLQDSGRALNGEYKVKLITAAALRAGSQLFLPYPARFVIAAVKSMKYIWKGLCTLARRKIEVPVLDATAIGVSMLRADIDTAGSIMFLLSIGQILEEWTHKKSVGDLARSMSLHGGKVWLVGRDGQEVLVPAKDIKVEDRVRIRMGNVVPFDGSVAEGEATVNQAALTGESRPVHKHTGSFVYAGTVLEDGELTVVVKEAASDSRYEKIVTMIEESQKLKSSLEGRAEHLADTLVPFMLGGTALTYLLTRNVTKALAVLMVDFSCALKLAMPISVLSAIREAGARNITVKGGKYLEAMAGAQVVVFDKTGTLTEARPAVVKVVPFNEMDEDELLRLAACMEEHFPHSMARAVVDAARKKGLVHEENHTKVEYIVAHGIATNVEGKRAVIGSRHFVMEDEGCAVPAGSGEKIRELPEEYSHLYLALEGELAAVICVEDPLRKEAAKVVSGLKERGVKKVIMMTGDSERTACAIADRVGVDEYHSEVLPEDKARLVEREKALGRQVVMLGDGINDSLALSSADVGIAVSDGAEIAREIADVTIAAENLEELIILREISAGLMKRIRRNYRAIVGFNTILILLGVSGVLQPTTSALLHNTSTLAISLGSMRDLL